MLANMARCTGDEQAELEKKPSESSPRRWHDAMFYRIRPKPKGEIKDMNAILKQKSKLSYKEGARSQTKQASESEKLEKKTPRGETWTARSADSADFDMISKTGYNLQAFSFCH